jgi:hypothetical protein
VYGTARTIVGTLVAAVLFVGCDGLWLDTYWRSDKYVLIAVDARGQMSLSVDIGNGMSVGLVGPTVFSIGADDKHIVVQQHPSNDRSGNSVDRTTTHYFIVTRTTSADIAARQHGVRGPLGRDEFDRLAAALSLPPFSKTFDDLR